MRFIQLTNEQRQQLTLLYKTSQDHRERQRAQALLLSERNYSIPDLADLFEVDRDTVSHWMDRWSAYAYLPRWSTGGDYCSCDLGWVPDYGPQGDVQSDALINGNRVAGRLVYNIPLKAIGRQYIEVRQYALTRSAYQYWTLFAQQASRTGSLFDPQPAPVEGNVHRADDPAMVALGYFGASAISRKRLILSPADTVDVKQFVYQYEKLFRLPGNCLRIYPQAQLAEPSNW